MRTLTRVLVGYVIVLAVAGYLVLSSMFEVLKPAMRQSAEETLVDSANLLARLVTDDLAGGALDDSDFAVRLGEYAAMRFNAEIWGVAKHRPNHRVYVTDADGIVRYDSSGRDVGADYSRWNDVYLTLRGRYGARSTAEDADDPGASVMYVAAPIVDGERIIGVLSVGKPNLSMQPFIDRAERRVWVGGLIAFVTALAVAAVIAWWNTRSVRALAAYARAVSAGRRVALPHLGEPELAALGRALEDMRGRLDGKAYIEHYVQALTHELKSPVASILGAAELLHDDLDAADRARLVNNIDSEAGRIAHLVERLLDLAQLEQRGALDCTESVDLAERAAAVVAAAAARIAQARVVVVNEIAAGTKVSGDPFLLGQALRNLLDNALDFTAPGGRVRLAAARADGCWRLACVNEGPPVPDYALARVPERFFSLPRPASGRKSSGLGLCFVAEIAALHGGRFELENVAGGVSAVLIVPSA